MQINDELINFFKKIPGAISVTEAIALYNLIIENMGNLNSKETFVDIGSHAGKSSLIAITALEYLQKRGTFLMVDPAYDLNGDFRKTGPVFAPPDYILNIHHNVSIFLVRNNSIEVFLISSTSEKFCEEECFNNLKSKGVFNPLSYVFIDSGEHSEESLKPEIEWVNRHLCVGGIVVFHDFGNQYTAPVYAAEKMILSGQYEPIAINWEEIISYVKENNLEKGNDSWHMVDNPHPNFIGALKRCR